MLRFDNPYVAPGPRAAFTGFLGSLSRLYELEGDPRLLQEKVEDTQIAAGQALWWATTLDEQLRDRYKSVYQDARDADEDGKAMPGAIFARNAITHGATRVHTPRDGLTFPITFPIQWQGLRWSTITDILAVWTPRSTKDLPAQKDSYATHFAGMQPTFGLGVLPSWFIRAAADGFSL